MDNYFTLRVNFFFFLKFRILNSVGLIAPCSNMASGYYYANFPMRNKNFLCIVKSSNEYAMLN